MRAAALFVLLAFAPPAGAQEDVAPDGPVLRVEFDETEAIPGQPLSLRMTVLVPTFLPEPPVWPSLEAPNLLVRLPERSTNPTSARVGGETWAGVTRNYRISPMVPGEFAIPPQEVVVTWADPESNAPARAILRSEALAFRGVVPAGAEGLDPFVAATSLELAQTIEGEPGAMTPGDSVTRTVVATVAGTAPMFLPELMPPVAIEGVAAYPDEPLIAETDDRGTLGGSRTERVTLVAEGGGSGAVPAVTLDWYDLETGRVETASVEGFAIAVEGPPARSVAPGRDWRRIALGGLAALAGAAAAVWLQAPRRAAARPAAGGPARGAAGLRGPCLCRAAPGSGAPRQRRAPPRARHLGRAPGRAGSARRPAPARRADRARRRSLRARRAAGIRRPPGRRSRKRCRRSASCAHRRPETTPLPR
ncbi:MAG: BatD family protein [Rhodovulum sp.]|nr:BatD family protein [Rhodovulum sp.]